MERGVLEEEMMSTDEFRPVRGYEDYYSISRHGSILSAKGNLLTCKRNSNGQTVVELRHRGKRELKIVKELVREAWGEDL